MYSIIGICICITVIIWFCWYRLCRCCGSPRTSVSTRKSFAKDANDLRLHHLGIFWTVSSRTKKCWSCGEVSEKLNLNLTPQHELNRWLLEETKKLGQYSSTEN